MLPLRNWAHVAKYTSLAKLSRGHTGAQSFKQPTQALKRLHDMDIWVPSPSGEHLQALGDFHGVTESSPAELLLGMVTLSCSCHGSFFS